MADKEKLYSIIEGGRITVVSPDLDAIRAYEVAVQVSTNIRDAIAKAFDINSSAQNVNRPDDDGVQQFSVFLYEGELILVAPLPFVELNGTVITYDGTVTDSVEAHDALEAYWIYCEQQEKGE